jgi:NRAMP (natural resistance-associated macrophage protein)-like metal ion transporter
MSKNLWQRLGPGFITGAADDDPSGIGTYSQTGAQFGYGQLWLALFSFPFMTVVQEMCGRIGIVTRRGLSGTIRRHYSRPVLYVAVSLLIIANTINIGADLGAMAAAGQLLLGVPFTVWLLGLTVLTLGLEIFVSYPRYAKILKYLTLSLLAYVVTAFVVKQDWSQVAWSTFVPSFSFQREYILNIVAVLGTTISPYLFFWQANEEVEEELGKKKQNLFSAIRDMRLDTAVGMFFSNLVMFFIIVTTASTLGAHGITQIDTAAAAAEALRPLAGNFTFVLFAIGIMGVGLLAVPILAGSASYAAVEAFDLPGGLNKKWYEARAFYGIIILATLVGVLINYLHIPPFTMLYYTAVLNGLVAPPLLLLILLISNNKKIMGSHTNGKWSNLLGVLVMLIMATAGVLIFVL